MGRKEDITLPFYSPQVASPSYASPPAAEQPYPQTQLYPQHQPQFQPFSPQHQEQPFQPAVVPFYGENNQFYSNPIRGFPPQPQTSYQNFENPKRPILSHIFLCCVAIFHLFVLTIGLFGRDVLTRIRILIAIWSGLLASFAIYLVITGYKRRFKELFVWTEVVVSVFGTLLELFSVFLMVQ